MANLTTLSDLDATIAQHERDLVNLRRARGIMVDREKLAKQLGALEAQMEKLLPVAPAVKRRGPPKLGQFLSAPKSKRVAWDAIKPQPPAPATRSRKTVPDGTRKEQMEECRRLGIRGAKAVAAHLKISKSNAGYLCSVYGLNSRDAIDVVAVATESPKSDETRDEQPPPAVAPPTPKVDGRSRRVPRGERAAQMEAFKRQGLTEPQVIERLGLGERQGHAYCVKYGLVEKRHREGEALASGEAFVPTAPAPPSSLVMEEDRGDARLDAEVKEMVGAPDIQAKVEAMAGKPVVVPFGISFAYDLGASAATRAQLKEETVRRQRGGKCRVVEFITVATKNHVHVATVDHFGDGQTNNDATGHVHRLCRWEMIEAHGHDHGLTLTPVTKP